MTRKQLLVFASVVTCVLLASACSQRPEVTKSVPGSSQRRAAGAERRAIDRVVRGYLEAVIAQDYTRARSLRDESFDSADARRSVLGRYWRAPASKFKVLRVEGETIIGGGPGFGYKPPGWTATATVREQGTLFSHTFQVDFGGGLGYDVLVQSAGIHSANP